MLFARVCFVLLVLTLIIMPNKVERQEQRTVLRFLDTSSILDTPARRPWGQLHVEISCCHVAQEVQHWRTVNCRQEEIRKDPSPPPAKPKLML